MSETSEILNEGVDITVTGDPTFQTTEFDIHTATGSTGVVT